MVSAKLSDETLKSIEALRLKQCLDSWYIEMKKVKKGDD